MHAENGTNGQAKRRGRGVPTKPAFKTLDDLDARTKAVQAARKLMADMRSDLGNDPTTGQTTLLARAAALHAWLTDAEVRFYEGGGLDLPSYSKASSELRLILMSVGIASREMKPAGGSSTAQTLDQHADRLRDADAAA